MFSRETIAIAGALIALYIGAVALSYWWGQRMRRAVLAKELEVRHQMYEIAIIKEISDRTGYSLNIQKILDVIVGSLNQFIEYSVASYMLLDPEKIIYRVDLERSVSPSFVKDVKERMLKSLSALLGRDLSGVQIEELLTGAITLEVVDEPVRSYFNIPLVIKDELVGVLTVAHTKAGLYKEEEMAILYKIVNQASLAVTKLEEVVKTEQGKIAAMLESMIEGVVMTDRDYRILAANPRAKEIIGYIKPETPTIFDFIDGLEGVLDIRGNLEQATKLDKTITLEEVSLRGKYYKVLVSPVKSNTGMVKGQILGGAVIFHDITHEKEVEKMRRDFTSMMVHELRSPLGNIKKIGEMMRSSKILEDKKVASEYVSMLYESSSSMLDLVNDLLDVARLEAGKFDVEKRPENIKNVVMDRVSFFDPTARAAGLTMTSSFDSTIPEFVEFDAKRIMQVMNNLISNAINHTPVGGTITIGVFVHHEGGDIASEARAANIPWVAGSLSLAAGEEGKEKMLLTKGVIVAVTDTGEGITEENLGKLWNKFTQFESSVRQKDHKGTGLGLVIVKGIVEAHNGMVGAVSKAGSGSTFYFALQL